MVRDLLEREQQETEEERRARLDAVLLAGLTEKASIALRRAREAFDQIDQSGPTRRGLEAARAAATHAATHCRGTGQSLTTGPDAPRLVLALGQKFGVRLTLLGLQCGAFALLCDAGRIELETFDDDYGAGERGRVLQAAKLRLIEAEDAGAEWERALGGEQ